MVLSRNKKNNVYPCKPQFYYIKWGLKGSELFRYVFVMRCYVFKMSLRVASNDKEAKYCHVSVILLFPMTFLSTIKDLRS